MRQYSHSMSQGVILLLLGTRSPTLAVLIESANPSSRHQGQRPGIADSKAFKLHFFHSSVQTKIQS